jgi:hypothetical protein
MNNILQFPTLHNEGDATGQVGPMQVMAGLYTLWVARVINRAAFFVGAHVCNTMRQHDVPQVVAAGKDFQNSVIRLQGALYAGAIDNSMSDYVFALQDLHFRGGIHNAMTESRVLNRNLEITHFTLSPELTAGRHYSMNTPIYFRLIDMTVGDYLKSVNRLADETLHGKTVIDLV